VGRDAVFLSDGHVDQLVESVGLYQIQSFFQLGIQASTKMIMFAGISVRMISRILAQVVEGLCVLHDSAGALSQMRGRGYLFLIVTTLRGR
jgi:hypothetical protein